MQTATTTNKALLLRSSSVFRPRQSAVEGKNLRLLDTSMDTNRNAKPVPKSVSLDVLRNAGDQYIADVLTLAELDRQSRIAAKFPDVYALLRELGEEWDRHAALYPEAAADGWLGLLMTRAKVLRAEIDGIANESRA